jgi:hypothetical protein
MSNRALWDIRRRHVWLSTSLKPKPHKLRGRKRCGLHEAQLRHAAKQPKASGEAGAEPVEG